jgi:hypothetical protein
VEMSSELGDAMAKVDLLRPPQEPSAGEAAQGEGQEQEGPESPVSASSSGFWQHGRART